MNEAEEKLGQNKDSLAALVMEPLMQGAAGMWSQPVEYVKAMAELCRRSGILFVLDEVATGFGRTGKMFAAEHAGVTPDILCLAKGITGGYLPLAATVTTEEVYSAFLGDYNEFKTFFHGHTYTGNPLGCAAALANLEVFKKDKTLSRLQPKIKTLARLLQPLRGSTQVGDIRQRGFIAAVELVKNRQTRKPYPLEARMGHRVAMEARRRGLLLRPIGNVIILMPPLSVSLPELRRMAEMLQASIETVT
jgi:adenosylmethionine-8-amino-7-oxononanoate aminotransferase